MDNLLMKNLPDVIQELRHSLNPYIRPKGEVKRIRKVLAKHLESHLRTAEGAVARPLSLVDSTTQAEQCPSSIEGLQRDYYRTLQANLKAREEYTGLSKDRLTIAGVQLSDAGPEGLGTPESSTTFLTSFLNLINRRRKLECLIIIRDHFDILSEKPAAAADSLEPQVLFKDLSSPPIPPPESLGYNPSSSQAEGTDLQDLADQLEKSVLKAKTLLRKEQKLLAKLRDEAQTTTETEPKQRRHALERTRNELISWIEEELAKAGDDLSEIDGIQEMLSPRKHKILNIDSQLAYVREQYARYVKARETLVLAAIGQLTAQILDKSKFTTDGNPEDGSNTPDPSVHVIYPLLEQLVCISDEQKSILQQKCLFTISLAKQLKEANQGLDRLADESHLLPEYQSNTTNIRPKGLGAAATSEQDILNHEKPDTTHRARAWVFASEAASEATAGYVDGKLEEGKVFTGEAIEAQLDLRRLVCGVDIHEGGKNVGTIASGNIWTGLDGSLGVIGGNDARA